MELQALSQADYLDILFENRNKKYGSYELRRHYAQRVQKAMTIVFGCAGLLIAYSQLKGHEQPMHINPPMTQPTCPVKIIYPEIPEQIKVQPPPPPAPSKPTVAFTVPVITKDNITTAPPDKSELADKIPGAITSTGGTDSTGDISGTSNATSTTSTTTKTISEEVIAVADVMPEFNGDLNRYLSRNLNYPARARENNIEGKVIIRFVVNEDGTVTGAKVMRGVGGGCDEEALRVVNNMPAWKPGMQAGKAVKVYYTLPLRFVLD